LRQRVNFIVASLMKLKKLITKSLIKERKLQVGDELRLLSLHIYEPLALGSYLF